MNKPDLQSILSRFHAGFSDPGMRTYLNFLVSIVDELKPNHVLEVGTGDGWGARLMMQVVPRGCRLTTVKLAGQNAESLEPWLGAKRLTVLSADSVPQTMDPVDFLFLHHVGNPQDQWHVYRKYLDETCVVAVDSVNERDTEWWTSLPYPHINTDLNGDHGFGLFAFTRIGDQEIRRALQMEES